MLMLAVLCPSCSSPFLRLDERGLSEADERRFFFPDFGISSLI